MTDVRNLLDLALSGDHGPAPCESADPAADVLRGKALLRRRRRRAGFAASAGLSAALAGVMLVPVVSGTASTPPASESASSEPSDGPRGTTRPTASVLPPVALVAYGDAQPPGYRVAQIPDGWVVQGGDAFALTIARADDPDREPRSYVGKLVVMLQSSDVAAIDPAHLAAGEQLVNVGGRPAVYRFEAASPQPGGSSRGVDPSAATYCVTVSADGTADGVTVTRIPSGVLVDKRVVRCDPADLPTTSQVPETSTVPAAQTLVYQLADGREAVVQVPLSLGWDVAHLIRFAEGVTVLTNAENGRG